jgi:hypothetical protein
MVEAEIMATIARMLVKRCACSGLHNTSSYRGQLQCNQCKSNDKYWLHISEIIFGRRLLSIHTMIITEQKSPYRTASFDGTYASLVDGEVWNQS